MSNSIDYFIIFIISILIYGCSPKVSTKVSKIYKAIDDTSLVAVLPIGSKVPNKAIVLGTLKVGDTGFSTNCDLNKVLEKAKSEARKVGGNAIIITKHKLPNPSTSSCDRITAQILKINDEKLLSNLIVDNTSHVDSTWNYAKIYVYRPSNSGLLVSYNLHLNDSIICNVKAKSEYEIILNKEGLHTLWARTETKTEIPINIEFGREYYLRCSVKMGAFVGRPGMILIDPMFGKNEYNNTK